jgi:acetyl esterase/lipase
MVFMGVMVLSAAIEVPKKHQSFSLLAGSQRGEGKFSRPPPMIRPLLHSTALLFCLIARAGAENDIRWLVQYDPASVPAAPTWTAHGKPDVSVADGSLRLADGSKDDRGFFRAAWKPEGDTEIIVEVTVRVGETTGAISKPGSRAIWPWRDGAPVSVLVNDGRCQEGLVFYPDRVSTWTDRFVVMDTAKEFHTYRLTIRGTDMSVTMDGNMKVRGQGAFWRKAPTLDPFIQFGSNSEKATGHAEWRSVRLGVRKTAAPQAAASVKITMSEPWPITRPDLKTKPTRPYVYAIGGGRLLLSVAEGPDALFEPYGVMLSTDAGRTWSPVKDWDFTDKAPLPMLQRKGGEVLGFSRWTWPQPEDGSFVGHTVRWDADLGSATSFASRLTLPRDYFTPKVPLTVERQVFEENDGSLRMAAYSKTGPSTPEGLSVGRRYSHLLRSADGGKTWSHDVVMGAGGEPAVAKLGDGRMTALLRVGPFKPFHQVFSEDDGKTWSAPVLIEEGSVCPDLVPMSNGLLACSYGRPANCLMFSADGGRTWTSHHVLTDKTGFNYSGIVEVSPGRLLYMHDAGGLQALYVDVERIAGVAGKKPTTDYALRTAKELKPTRSVVYKTDANYSRELRIFEPDGHKPADKRPCFLAIHGGGWTAGVPDVMYCVADHFAKQGWLGVSMQYRVQRADRGTTVFDAVRDARSAVRYLRAHSAELGIDPNRIVAGGRSAGGHLAIGAAIFDGMDEAGEDTNISCVPNAVLCYSAVLDTSENGYGRDTIGERWQELSPLLHVRSGLPPTLVLHGIRDTLTPVAGAKAFADAMTKAGNQCELILHKRGNHSYMMRTEPLFDEAMRQTRDFLARAGISVPGTN